MSQVALGQTIDTYYEQGVRDPDGRYRSWEHCYGFFREHCRDLLQADNTAALQLGFYLASWGMYRGSSFLLQRTYTAHRPVIHALASPQFSNLWQRDVGTHDDDGELAVTIMALVESVKASYERFGKPTDTLATKVLLGTDQRQIEFPQRRLEIPTQGLKKKSCSRPLRRPFPRSSFL